MDIIFFIFLSWSADASLLAVFLHLDVGLLGLDTMVFHVFILTPLCLLYLLGISPQLHLHILSANAKGSNVAFVVHGDIQPIHLPSLPRHLFSSSTSNLIQTMLFMIQIYILLIIAMQLLIISSTLTLLDVLLCKHYPWITFMILIFS